MREGRAGCSCPAGPAAAGATASSARVLAGRDQPARARERSSWARTPSRTGCSRQASSAGLCRRGARLRDRARHPLGHLAAFEGEGAPISVDEFEELDARGRRWS